MTLQSNFLTLAFSVLFPDMYFLTFLDTVVLFLDTRVSSTPTWREFLDSRVNFSAAWAAKWSGLFRLRRDRGCPGRFEERPGGPMSAAWYRDV